MNVWMPCKVYGSTFSNERVVELGDRDFVVPTEKVQGDPGKPGKGKPGKVAVGLVHTENDGWWAKMPTYNPIAIPLSYQNGVLRPARKSPPEPEHAD